MSVSRFIEDYYNILGRHHIVFYLWMVDRYDVNREIPSTKIINDSYIGKRHTQRVLAQLTEVGLLRRSKSGSMHLNYEIKEHKVPMRLVG